MFTILRATNGSYRIVKQVDKHEPPPMGHLIVRTEKLNQIVKEYVPPIIHKTKFDRARIKDINAAKDLYKEKSWGPLFKMHNQEGWSTFHYCCGGQVKEFKKHFDELLGLG